jgi:hypothetical protein
MSTPRSLSLLTCLALVLAAPPTRASGPAEPPAEEDPALAEAKRLFDAGVARYTAADYTAAVDLWLQAYALLPSTYDNRMIKAELIYNVARAQQKSFDIDHDPQHLRQARETLLHYIDELDDLYGDQAPMEREKVDDQLADIDEQLAAWEAEQAKREAELAERMRPKFDEAADARERKRNQAMVIAGGSLTALGLGGAGMLVAGIVLAAGAERTSGELPLVADIPARQAAISRGQTGNALMLIGTLSGAVFLGAGVPLLGVGLAAERKREQRREAAGVAQLGLPSPMWLPGGGGIAFAGRF